MNQKVNKYYASLFKKGAGIRYTILMGGRGAGRSTVASQYALARLKDPSYFRAAIMRYILGDIRNSIYKEIIDRIDENDARDTFGITDNLMAISHGMNSINAVGFKKSSGDQTAKLKSLANYNCVIIEEADETTEADFMQLDDSLRTTKGDITIILLLNPPPKTHWIVQRWFDLEEQVPGFYMPKLKAGITDTLYIHTTYTQNITNISEATQKNYEGYQLTKPDHYYNMIRGLVPETVRGRIYNNWKILPEVPHEARYVASWLDFGFTNDPTSAGDIYEYNGGYIADEVIYQKGLLNHQIAAALKNKPRLIIADSADPRTIAELQLHGLSLLPSDKGSDSIRSGITIVQGVAISLTARSIHTIKESENYAWEIDKNGNELNAPKPGWDHSMDGIRYAITYLRPAQPKTVDEYIEDEEPRYSRIGV